MTPVPFDRARALAVAGQIGNTFFPEQQRTVERPHVERLTSWTDDEKPEMITRGFRLTVADNCEICTVPGTLPESDGESGEALANAIADAPGLLLAAVRELDELRAASAPVEPTEGFGTEDRPEAGTASGLGVWFDAPERTPFVLDDVLVPLGRLCRYTGAIQWTVLQHTVLCILLGRRRGYSPRVLAHVAAHDFAEAYLGDVSTHLKRRLPAYQRIERAWEAHVEGALGLDDGGDARAQVKAVDVFARRVEMHALGHGLRHLVEHPGPELDLVGVVFLLGLEELGRIVRGALAEGGVEALRAEMQS